MQKDEILGAFAPKITSFYTTGEGLYEVFVKFVGGGGYFRL
jgi:hypothetical protein